MTGGLPVGAGPACGPGPVSPPACGQIPSDEIGVPMSETAGLSSVTAAEGAGPGRLGSPAGIVAGPVLRAGRLSACLTQAELGEATGIETNTIAAWEDGIQSLADVPYPVFEQLETALTAAGAEPRLVSDLAPAVWCDLVVTAIADGQDAKCLMADPTAAEEAFAELLTWSAAGQRPARYRPYIGPGPLLRPADVDLITVIVRGLDQAHCPRPHAA
jgi:transcriptional regulator with XRE-family HTH domain